MKKVNLTLKLSPTKLDKRFLDFFQKHLNLIFLIIITILAIYSRNSFRGYLSGDMLYSIQPWTAHLKNNGGFLGIPSLQSNYTVFYQYILAFISYLPANTIAKVKIVNWIFDVFAAVIVGLIIAKLTKRSKFSCLPILGYTISLFVPGMFINSALWGQCDIIHNFFILLSFYFLIDESYPKAFIFYGLALSVKLQATFLLPVLVILYFKTRKFSIFNFLFIPLVYLVCYIPALLLGKPFSQLFQAFGWQIADNPRMVLGLPNLYALLPDDYELFSVGAYILTAIVIGTIAYLVLSDKKIIMTPYKKFELGLIISIAVVFFLPKMHERYMFTSDLFAIIYLFMKPKRFYIPVIIWLINAMSHLPYLFGTLPWIDHRVVALILLFTLLFLIYDFFKTAS
ncbi:MAG: hypothetical protein GX813_04830, partial [Erysipelotrichia bacterium]|nr:hypothetical protein [Erysipelotrichia bacterium]